MTDLEPLVIAVDVDDVLADNTGPWIAWYNKEFGDDLQPSQILTWDLTKWVKLECDMQIFRYLHQPDIYSHVKALPGALAGVNYLRNYGRVVFATTEVDGQSGRKFYWLKEHGFEPEIRDYVELRDKHLLRYDVLIDDGLHNFWKDTEHGCRILFDQPWNRMPVKDTYDYVMLDWHYPRGFFEEHHWILDKRRE